ncbi:MAG: carboxypeptidase-like regulatory domain-containing protein [Bryobacterales bacterium]|nr:carboxypeptidase-like regulatory domain-containing protein [Bryobacterales bacterium]
MTRRRMARTILAGPAGAAALIAGKKPEKGRSGYATIAGTVFRDPGFAFPGVSIVLQPDAEAGTSVKVKKMKAVSDNRGEFAFHVPAAPMRYKLSASAQGYVSDERLVTISGEERQDVYFTLKAGKEGGSQ